MSIKYLILIVMCCGKMSSAQLSSHTDANINSFLLKTPNLQQSFTRYYGGAQTSNLQQAHQQQQQTEKQQQNLQTPIEQETQQQQDFMENVGLGAMTIAGNMMDIMSNGGAIRREDDMELPFVKAHSKTEMGIGEAIRSQDLDSSEEYNRRKRSALTFDEIWRSNLRVHRNKRSPCHNMQGGGGGDGTDYADVVERRRRKVKNSRKSKILRKNKKKHLIDNEGEDVMDATDMKENRRRRRKRQTEVEDLNATTQQDDKSISEKAKQFAEKVRYAWGNFVDKISEMAKTVRDAFASN